MKTITRTLTPVPPTLHRRQHTLSSTKEGRQKTIIRRLLQHPGQALVCKSAGRSTADCPPRPLLDERPALVALICSRDCVKRHVPVVNAAGEIGWQQNVQAYCRGVHIAPLHVSVGVDSLVTALEVAVATVIPACNPGAALLEGKDHLIESITSTRTRAVTREYLRRSVPYTCYVDVRWALRNRTH